MPVGGDKPVPHAIRAPAIATMGEARWAPDGLPRNRAAPYGRTPPSLKKPEWRRAAWPSLATAGAADPTGNLAGLPALVFPCGFADNLPVALQVVGAPFSENLLLSIGREFQARTDWHRRRPPGL